MSGRRTSLFVLIAAACVLGLTACGGGGSSSGSQSSSSTTATTGSAGNNVTGDPVVAKAFETYSGEKNVTCVTSGVTNLSNNKPVYLCTGQESGGSPVPCAPMVWDGKNVSKPDVNGAFDTGNGTFSC
jgi:hypothetical protein